MEMFTTITRVVLINIFFFISQNSFSQNNWNNSNISTITNGKVGIGNLNPLVPIEIGTINDNSIIKRLKINGTYNFEQLNLGIGNNGNSELEFVTHSGINTSGGIKFYTTDNANLEIQSAAPTSSYSTLNYIARVSILNNGNVGIGTTNPGSYKLAVEGKIGAREVVVTTASWADYVFENTYNLRPLSQVETFIKENKHLPEIPSAKEVEANGINLGEMDALLLKKIEELTLYVIEQEKRIKLQNLKIMELEKLHTN